MWISTLQGWSISYWNVRVEFLCGSPRFRGGAPGDPVPAMGESSFTNALELVAQLYVYIYISIYMVPSGTVVI